MSSRSERFAVAFPPAAGRPDRLDTYLRSQFPVVSRATLQRLIRDGDVRVDGRPVKPTHRPQVGEMIEITWPEPRALSAEPEAIPLEIIFEDDDLVVVNKPAGLVVHPAAGHPSRTLVNALLHHCQHLSGIGGVMRPGIVHRLDKDTSGCLSVAKNDFTHQRLAEQFAGRTVAKTYHALVCGAWPEKTERISAPISRHPTHRKQMAVRAAGGGREAATTCRPLERFENATLVAALPETGRTHQIRVHLQYIGCPLLGDQVYGARQNKRFAEQTGIDVPRQMLHAYGLAFVHPRTRRKLKFQAEWPDDFRAVVEALRRGQGAL